MPVEHVEGDLLDTEADVYAHQISSLPCRAHGLSAAVAARHPWADHYGQRTQMGTRNLATPNTRPPCGSIQEAHNPNGGFPRAIMGMVGQLDFGRPGYSRSRVYPGDDTPAKRLAWFGSAFGAVCAWAQTHGCHTVALPHRVGCGLGGGDWAEYQLAIDRIAAAHPRLTVLIVRKP